MRAHDRQDATANFSVPYMPVDNDRSSGQAPAALSIGVSMLPDTPVRMVLLPERTEDW